MFTVEHKTFLSTLLYSYYKYLVDLLSLWVNQFIHLLIPELHVLSLMPSESYMEYREYLYYHFVNELIDSL